MNDVKSFCRKGFTLIELLVVIGIIAVLIAATLPMLGGSRDSAMAAKCMANMRNLAEAALVFANRNADDHGYYPVAGFYRSITIDIGERKPKYFPRHPWISNLGSPNELNRTTEKPISGEVPHFTYPPERSTFAITNGALWGCTGHAFDIYRCPVHSVVFEKANGFLPAWSFMMNQVFGYDKSGKGVGGIPGGSIKNSSINGRNPDRVLMFAEVQGENVNDKKHNITLKALTSGTGLETDGVLQYDKEVIGFNHPLGKGRYCGHVAFADGHIEKIVMPREKQNFKKLTQWLCKGADVMFDGKKGTYTSSDDNL